MAGGCKGEVRDALGSDPAELAVLGEGARPAHHVGQDVGLEVLADDEVGEGAAHIANDLVAAAEREGQAVALEQEVGRVRLEDDVDARVLRSAAATAVSGRRWRMGCRRVPRSFS